MAAVNLEVGEERATPAVIGLVIPRSPSSVEGEKEEEGGL